MNVLHLLHLGYSRQQSAQIVGCHRNSVTNVIKMYNTGGLEAVRQLSYSKSRHELASVIEEVDELLESSNCNTIADVAAILRQKFNYNRRNKGKQVVFPVKSSTLKNGRRSNLRL